VIFGRMRWLAVILPGLVAGLLEQLSDHGLDQALPSPWDTLLIVGLVVSLSAIFSFLVFRRIDLMAGVLARQNAELERRNATVRALHRVSLATTAITDLDRVLQLIVDQARELLRADGAVLLIDGATGEPTRRSASGIDLPAESGAAGGSRLEAPLQLGGQTFGRLVVASRRQRSYGADEVETLASFANQATIAVEHARLQERLRGLAVAEERERIAREMHDGLAQVLGYVNTKSQAVEHLLDSGRVAEARGQLDQLASAARSIYVDVREAILGLRSAIDPAMGLVPAIQTYATRIAEASKLVVEVRASPEAIAADLPEPAERHLFRIVQEALTNVRKHAQARRVTISLEVVGADLVVTVADDGQGMGAAAGPADWPRYGVAAMRERAAAMGASIDWSSTEDGGTTVRLEIPLEHDAPERPLPEPRPGGDGAAAVMAQPR
jgi:signal transduction histidine kinase